MRRSNLTFSREGYNEMQKETKKAFSKMDKTLLPLSWQNFDDYCHMLVEKIRKSKVKFKNIYGEPRGGLVVAVRLSHLLGIPVIVNTNFATERTLFVDDIVDTGKTYQYVRLHHKIAVLFWNPNALFEPTFYVSPKVPNSWIVFPWEKGLKHKMTEKELKEYRINRQLDEEAC
jgi:hypoxanthine phosphoribosyltransferase